MGASCSTKKATVTGRFFYAFLQEDVDGKERIEKSGLDDRFACVRL